MEVDSPLGGIAPSGGTSSQSSSISSSYEVVFNLLADELAKATRDCIEFARNASEASELARQRDEAYQGLKLRAAALEAALEDRNGRIKTAKLEADRASAAHDECVAQFLATKREADKAYAAGQASIAVSGTTAEASSSTSISLESAIKRVVDEVRAVHGTSARKAVWSAVLNELRGPEVAVLSSLLLPPPPPPLPYLSHTHTQNDNMARKFKAELKELLSDSDTANDGGAVEDKQLRYIRTVVMPSVAKEMKKVYEDVPEINVDGSLRSINMPGLLAMLNRGETPYLVGLLTAMITTPHRAKEDAKLARVLHRMESGISDMSFMPRTRKGRDPPVPWDMVSPPLIPRLSVFMNYRNN